MASLLRPDATNRTVPVPDVPGWLLEAPCGAGGQGVVWRAVRETDEQPGAVKVFRTSSPEQAARLDAEAEILTKLDHVGIVCILDHGSLPDGSLFLVTEYVDGCDLARLMRAARLAPERVLAIASQVADALAHAHSRGVVHRDLKPANIMDSGDGAVRLLDFSFASGAQPGAETLTLSGTAFGTPYYMAPERLRHAGDTPAGPESDIYALGVLLYEMLTGAPPLGRYGRASEKSGMPRETDSLLDTMLAESPAARPVAGEVQRRLAQLGTLLKRCASRRKWRRRLWTGAAVAAGIAAAWAAGYSAPRPAVEISVPALNAKGFPNPAAATRDQLWTNSLNMSFRPVPGQRSILLSVYETRMSEWQEFERFQQGPEGAEWEAVGGSLLSARFPIQTLTLAGWTTQPVRDLAPDPGFSPPPQAAAWGMTWAMGRRFCAWLTWREQKQGRIGPGEYYRLPMDAEWSAAAGVTEETGTTPQDRHRSLPQSAPRFPWGDDFPPPPGFANYAGTEARDLTWPPVWLSLTVQNDAFPRVSPVGAFPPNAAGFHDLWGNVWEWCEDQASPSATDGVLRGGSWTEGGYQAQFRRDFRFMRPRRARDTATGFRCVLVFAPP